MRRSPLLRPVCLGLVWFLLPVTACAPETGEDRTSEPSSTSTSPGGGGPGGPCGMTMPGVILSAAEAVVRFDPGRICPSYVTVEAGTKVTFRFEGEGDSDVRVLASADAAKPLASTQLAAGEEWEYTPTAIGSLYFRVSAIPTFLGVIEVPAAPHR